MERGGDDEEGSHTDQVEASLGWVWPELAARLVVGLARQQLDLAEKWAGKGKQRRKRKEKRKKNEVKKKEKGKTRGKRERNKYLGGKVLTFLGFKT